MVSALPVIENSNDLTVYRELNLASPVIIKNCVATAFFGCRLDLEEIAWKCHAEFDPKSFAAAKLRLASPQSTALLFASGKIVCTGAASETSARVAVTEIYRIVSSIMHPGETSLIDLKIENIVGTAYLGYKISLKRAYEWMRETGDVTVMYSPELFPGLRFEIKKWTQGHESEAKNLNTKVLGFQDGNVVITGGKSRKDLSITWKIIRNLFTKFQLSAEVSSTSHNVQCFFFSMFLIFWLFTGSAAERYTHRWQKNSETEMRVAFITLVLIWLWLISKLGVEWNRSRQHEKRRVDEATLLIATMCRVDTNNLAREFALCEEAHVLVEDGTHGMWLRAFERTFRVVAMDVVRETGALSLATITNALLVVCAMGLLAATCNIVTKYLNEPDDFNVLSPIAQNRLQSVINLELENIGYIDMKKTI